MCDGDFIREGEALKKIFFFLLLLLRLVVACRHHPEPIVMTLVNFVAPSRPIVIYCHLLEVNSL